MPFQRHHSNTFTFTARGKINESNCDDHRRCVIVLGIEVPANETRNLVFEFLESNETKRYEDHVDVYEQKSINRHVNSMTSLTSKATQPPISGWTSFHQKGAQSNTAWTDTVSWKKYRVPQCGTIIYFSVDGSQFVNVLEIYIIE